MFKRLLATVLCAIMAVSLMSGLTFTASAADYVNQSHMLKVKGNKLVWEDDESVEVVLSGVNIPGGEWTGTPGAEQMERNIQEAMNNWHCNVIRLAVGTKGWNGGYEYGNAGDLANQLKYAIEHQNEMTEYVEKAYKYAIEHLTAKNNAEKIMEVYKEVEQNE